MDSNAPGAIDPANPPEHWPKTDEALDQAAALMPYLDEHAPTVGEDLQPLDERDPVEIPAEVLAAMHDAQQLAGAGELPTAGDTGGQ